MLIRGIFSAEVGFSLGADSVIRCRPDGPGRRGAPPTQASDLHPSGGAKYVLGAQGTVGPFTAINRTT